MNQEKLIQTYNTLSLIKTEGQNTILMANCLLTLKDMIESDMQSEQVQDLEQSQGDHDDTR